MKVLTFQCGLVMINNVDIFSVDFWKKKRSHVLVFLSLCENSILKKYFEKLYGITGQGQNW